jgi:PTH2 family peptidyl-tRNA hydrolase
VRVVKQVIVIRKDLRMRRGKEIAQGAHASIAWLVKRLAGRPMFARTDMWQATGYFTTAEREWMREGFRKITVQVDTEEDLLRVHEAALAAGLVSELIRDSGTTEFAGVPTYTACAIGPDYDDKIDPITGDLNLY